MLKKITFIAFVFFALFGSKHGIFAMETSTAGGYGLEQKAPLIYAWPEKQRLTPPFLAHKKWIKPLKMRNWKSLKRKCKN